MISPYGGLMELVTLMKRGCILIWTMHSESPERDPSKASILWRIYGQWH